MGIGDYLTRGFSALQRRLRSEKRGKGEAAPVGGPLSHLGTLIDDGISIFSPEWGLQRKAARQLMASSAFRGASRSRLRNDWSVGAEDPTPTPWDAKTLRERSQDLNRNDAIASGITDTFGLNVAGEGLRLQSKLRASVLGISEERAEAIRTQIEDVWEEWCLYCDAAEKLTFGEIQFMTIRKVMEDGDLLVLPTWINKRWHPLARRIELVEAHRLENPYGAHSVAFDTDATRNGITFGKAGEALTYYIRKATNNKFAQREYEKVAARDSKGRPKVLHLFRPTRPGQERGIPLFAPILTLFKDHMDVRQAYVIKERIQSCLAIIFTSKGNPVEKAIRAATGTESSPRDKTTTNRLQGIEPGLIHYDEEGAEVTVVDPGRTNEGFAVFAENTIRQMGAALGLPYELILKDFSKTNYSSARAALLEGRRVFKNWRTWLGLHLCQPIFRQVLEEAVARGQIDAPGFDQHRNEYFRSSWIGGGWGWVDPVKEVQASKLAVDYSFSTEADECAAQGRDWEEVKEQRAREIAKDEKLGLTRVVSSDMNDTVLTPDSNGENEKKEGEKQ
jgi:lambda family phage portal protein